MSSKKTYPRLKSALQNNLGSLHSEQEIDQPSFRYGQPLFKHPMNPGLFDLSSHKRAKKAIDFALKMRDKQFHVVVIGENRSGRMSSTLSFLEDHAKTMDRPSDWVYLNNFEQSYKPIPFILPNGMGKYLKKKLSTLIQNIHTIINQQINSPSYLSVVETLTAQIQHDIDAEYKKLMAYAQEKGFKIEQTDEGLNIEPLESNEEFCVNDLADIREKLSQITLTANLSNQDAHKKIKTFRKQNIKIALIPLYEKFIEKFSPYLGQWITALENDILENIDLFLILDDDFEEESFKKTIEERYAVNLFVDNTNKKNPKVLLVDNPTYENLFGTIQYITNPAMGNAETNFTMIKPGALHLANGGFLVLRVDAIVQDPDLWNDLKAALRDQQIRIYEKHRENALPILDAPKPRSIPLDVQVFLITSPYWYYTLLQQDPDFETYFKIKAEIDPDMPYSLENTKAYHRLLRYCAKQHHGHTISAAALKLLTNYSARKAGHIKKLSSQFEIILDLLDEAVSIQPAKKRIDVHTLQKAMRLKYNRHARIEEESYEQIKSNTILIETHGKKIGQVNALTVIDMGDHEFGLPTRITAQTYASNRGIVNIERITEMAGPIQQKGALVLEGFLNGTFAQDFPLSCGCSLTFEQSYSDVDGDSASMAELLAILSSLSGTPIRQDIAITGSINQFGAAQAVGGVYAKVEGFYSLCLDRGITKKQGVILPGSNIDHLTLRNDIQNAIDKGEFHIYPIISVYEAINFLFDEKIPLIDGFPDSEFDIMSIALFQKIYKKLGHYHKALFKRHQEI